MVIALVLVLLAPYRAFSVDSVWNTPLGNRAPLPNSGAIVSEIKGYVANDGDYPRLAVGTWSAPIYFSDASDPVYTITPTSYGPVLQGVHIPAGARPAATSDGEMTVFDMTQGVEFWLWRASDSWTAQGTDE